MLGIRGGRPRTIAPTMGGGYIVIIDAAGITVGPVLVLGTIQITVFCRCTGVGTRFGVSAFGTCVAAEGMV